MIKKQSNKTKLENNPVVGILAAAGEATRIKPANLKHLQLIYDKPAIYYHVSNFIKGGISKIMVACSPSSFTPTFELLGTGEEFGLQIDYAFGNPKGGPVSIFKLEKVINFIGSARVCFMLDGFYLGDNFDKCLVHIVNKQTKGCAVIAAAVKDPRPFGLFQLKKNSGINIIEKPTKIPSGSLTHLVQTHLYVYDNSLVKRVRELQPGYNNELGVTELHKSYLDDNQLLVEKLDGDFIWEDCGTPEKLHKLSTIIKKLQGGLKLIGSPHLEAYRQGFINRQNLRQLAKPYGKKTKYYETLYKIALSNIE